MSTQFFERQETQRKYTRWLVWGFVAAILAVVLVINLVVLVGLGGDPRRVFRHEPEVVFWISVIVLGTILIASWHRSSQLRAGGATVARSLGGVPVTAADGDLKRQQLVNIVEEMAIAARIRKPQVFVLPDEAGINAFAAGHSPDEAAVAVTQGALDALDREQLQAVIGHEFSHILNGDMKINMRLTAWIFGLFVITDLARRFMRSRGRGRAGARLKVVAFGIFIAGSVGMLAGRLLQAAVSRRREHLADASSVQFTRNPQALQGAFVVMAAAASGTRLVHEASSGVAHMFFAGSDPAWANKIGASWFATHPPLEERVRALDARVTSVRFRSLVSDERRKGAAKPATASDPAPAASGGEATSQFAADAASAAPEMRAMAMPVTAMAGTDSPTASGPRMTLAETMPSGVRMVAGRSLPPDVLRNRLAQDQQAAIGKFVAEVENSTLSVQATFVAAMLATEPAKWRTQLTRLAPVLGIELLKETQRQVARVGQLASAARLPLLCDLLILLPNLESADRKRLRAVARAFAPTVATGDMLRYSLTRMLEKRLAKAADEVPPVPLPDRAAEVCVVYSALAQCSPGAGKQGNNAYRAGLMGMLPPKSWAPFPEEPATPAQLDAALIALDRVHPTGKRSFSEGLARVIAVSGRLTVPQIDLLRGVCLSIDCQVPLIPIDVVFEDIDVRPPANQATAR
ncbi:MAG TPA: M48 family metallopeptidase [Steroidobacteraceae bacterium]|nr:M48 family metallopeptidase [Steroidobacteraceae bacterium]